MRPLPLGRLAGALLFAGVSSLAHSAVVVNNGLPNQSGGANMSEFLEADDFTIAGPTQLQLVRFWSLQGSAADYAGSISWSICANASGAPSASCAASGSASPAGTATGNTTLGLNEFVYEFAVNLILAAGDYWLVLQNGSSPSTSSFYWAYSDDQQGNSQSLELALGGAAEWAGNVAELAFQLEGQRVQPPSVPEPGSLLLAATALGAAFVRRRTSKRSQA